MPVSASGVIRPRVFAPETHEAIPISDALDSWLQRHPTGIVFISGAGGSGKTTALNFLEALFPSDGNFTFLDEPPAAELLKWQRRHDSLVVSACSTPTFDTMGTISSLLQSDSKDALSLQLAPWCEDDWIEYLLANAPEECSSVMARLLQADDRQLLGGNPELSVIVLNQLIQDPALKNVRTALIRHLDILLPDQQTRAQARLVALKLSCGRAEFRPSENADEIIDEINADKSLPPELQIIRHAPIGNLLATEQILADLRSCPQHSTAHLHWQLPPLLIQEIAHALDPPTRQELVRIQSTQNPACNAMTVSILVANRPDWRPLTNDTAMLEYAVLDGVNWTGIDLSQGDLNFASFCHANLAEARLTKASAIRCDFSNATLTGVIAKRADFSAARFVAADLSHAKLANANFSRADVGACCFDHSLLLGAQFIGAQLNNTRFCGCLLSKANFTQANLDGADFTNANLTFANLSQADLTNTVLSGARLHKTRLIGCNLEYVNLPKADLTAANLQSALLTGSRMPNANFRYANLTETGLADIDWEGADLRGVDLRGATFHMGSSRSGLVGSYLASEGTRTGFYTDEYHEQHFKSPEEVRVANLCGADLRGARVTGVDFYLVDLRGAVYTADQREHFLHCRAILGTV